MVDHSEAVTVNLERFEPDLAKRFKCIVLNLEIRESSEAQAEQVLARALELVGPNPVAARIDSTLRGHVKMFVEMMLQRGDVIVTDTIPDYGRRTASGRTYLGGREGDIESTLSPLQGRRKGRSFTIADSETEDDLDGLAESAVTRSLIPIDPGPLIARVVKRRLGLGPRPVSKTSPKVSTVAFVVGTRDSKSLEQLEHMKAFGYSLQKLGPGAANEVDIFSFSLEDDKHLLTGAFLNRLSGYDALVLTGGATANHILERSGFRYLLNEGEVQPLVSSATVIGGLYDGKRVVLKGGSIGDGKTYKTIFDWLSGR
jgi:uncharacterized protein YgbK (DUF1537 family)